MLPPSDSFLHQSLKLAEVTANMQNQETLTRPPPPPYSIAQSHLPASHDEIQSDIDAEDDETTWDTHSPNPVTINIDASISVQGNSNTIVMASSSGPNLKQQTGPSPSPEQPDTPSSPASATAVLQAAQQHRQAKLTDMATAIIAALQNSRDFPLGGDGMGSIPIEININTGVKIEGSKNVICAGGDTGRVLPRKRDGQNTTITNTTTNDNNNDGEPVDEDDSNSKKRQAQSVFSLRLPSTTTHCDHLDY